MTEPAVPEALQRAAEAVATEVLGFANRYQRPDADELSDIFIRHVLAAKVCVEPEHQEFMRYWSSFNLAVVLARAGWHGLC